jgi:hypothetical protein
MCTGTSLGLLRSTTGNRRSIFGFGSVYPYFVPVHNKCYGTLLSFLFLSHLSNSVHVVKYNTVVPLDKATRIGNGK